MDIATLALMGARYIVKLIGGSKTFEEVKENTLNKSWSWVKRRVLGQQRGLGQAIEQTADPAEKEKLLTNGLTDLLQNESFKQEFLSWMEDARQDPMAKNVFDMTIKEIEGNITVGDNHTSGAGSQSVRTGQNIAKGKIGKMKGDFRVGDTFE